MKTCCKALFNLFFVSTLLSACGGSSPSGDGLANPQGKNPGGHRVNWAAVPAEFNPSIEDLSFDTRGVNKINVGIAASGFDEDVEVVYDKSLSASDSYLRVYKVWKKSATWPNLTAKNRGDKMELAGYGTSSCAIRTTNGAIVELEGGCYVRVELYLPESSQIEVYSQRGTLKTARFIPISNEDFLSAIDKASFAEGKFSVIEEFLNSYVVTKKTARLMTFELKLVLQEFPFKDDRFKALRMLHAVVTDRNELGSMIEDTFSRFEQDEARKIVGL